MNRHFKINVIKLALCLAYPALGLPALAAEPFPALPPTQSTAVTPNILLHVDNSGSMANNAPGTTSKKIDIAKNVAKNMIENFNNLYWGLFSFDSNSTETAGILVAPVQDVSNPTVRSAFKSKIDALTTGSWTPLGETLFEISHYWAGEESYYGKDLNDSTTSTVTEDQCVKNTGNATCAFVGNPPVCTNTNTSKNSNGSCIVKPVQKSTTTITAYNTKYKSPILYRCQKNFNIIVTDGVATKDNWLPGLPNGTGSYPGFDYQTFNAAGARITKTFKACKDQNTVSSVTCPVTLEGPAHAATRDAFTGTPDDTSSSNYGRAVRDVAMYSYDRDFKVGGTDAEGQSWDDPKFPLQNVATYTIGFAVDDPVLSAAAIVGHGKYFTAGNELELTKALTEAVNEIVAQISNGGGVAVQNETLTAGNKIFQPVFNPKGWYGELRCFNLNANGSIGGVCSPNAKAVIPAESSRQLYSSSVTSKFNFNTSISDSNLRTLLGPDAATQNNVINFVRGANVAGSRARPNGLLGDIIDGQPLVVSKPNGVTSDPDYSKFVTDSKDRNIVFIGANDGMLHAFNIADMTELMGYVPSAVYPHLKPLMDPDYGTPGGSAPHTWHVNGGLRQQDAKLGGKWQTIVVGGLAQGGQGYFAVNATSNATLTGGANSAVQWEWNDQRDAEMGYSFPTPLIYNVRISHTEVVPAVILANGYENGYDDTVNGYGKRVATCTAPASCNTSALYILRADNGTLLKKISLPGSADGVGGLSSPAGVDFGQDGILDYVYAGDMRGRVWRFDLTGDGPDQFGVALEPIFDAGLGHPITIRPAIMGVTRKDGTSLGNLVLFGTGKLMTDADRVDETQQSFYAVLDDMSNTPTTVTRDDLLERTVVDKATVSGAGFRGGDYRQISSDPAGEPFDLLSESNTKKGWYLDFPMITERLVTVPILLSDRLLFGTGVTNPGGAKVCLSGGEGWVMGLNPMTGSVVKSAQGKEFSFIDVKIDGKSTVEDKVKFSDGAAYVSGYSVNGIPTELTYVAASSNVVTANSGDSGYGDSGSVIALYESNASGVFDANAAAGTTTGKAQGRQQVSGKGKILVPDGGDPDKPLSDPDCPPGIDCASGVVLGAGIRVMNTTWRELR